MRRTIPAAALALATVIGFATPAFADDTPTTQAPARAAAISLACHEVTVDAGKPAIHCDWDAYDGAAAYRVVGTVRRGRHGRFVVRKTTETAFTRTDVRPGSYSIVVQALDADGKAMARSNREHVVVERTRRAAS